MEMKLNSQNQVNIEKLLQDASQEYTDISGCADAKTVLERLRFAQLAECHLEDDTLDMVQAAGSIASKSWRPPM